MQKRKFTFLFLIAIVLSYSTFAEAALQFLPRYQGGYGTRTQQGGRDKVCDSIYQYACSGTGYAGGVGTACNDLYPSCSCSTNYKWSGGSCVLKSCSDYGYSASKDNTKSCEEKTPRSGLTCYVCTACDSSTYKYACSGGLNASAQGTTNKCGTNYSECSCVEHASWNSTSGKCECGSDYKAGTTSCTLKTCEDYGYSATEDTTKDCTKQTPRSGLTCWSCSACTGTLYDCSSMANASGGSGTACGGKYPQCTCKSGYFWDSGKCSLSCTRNSCSTTTYPLTAQNAANASSYEKCTPSCSDESPRYKVSACASGYSVNSNGSGCEDAHVHSYHCQPGYQETNEWGADADIYPKVCDCGEIAGNTLCYKGRHVHSFHCPTGSPYQEVNEWGADAETFPMYCDCGEKSSTLVCYKAPACGSEFVYNCEQGGGTAPEWGGATCEGLSTYCECENGKHWNKVTAQCEINKYEFEICTGITDYHQLGTIYSLDGDLDIDVYIDGQKVGTVEGPQLYGMPPHGGGDYWHPAEPQWKCKTFEVSGASTLMLEHRIYARGQDGGYTMCYSYGGQNFTWVNDNGMDYVQPSGSCQKWGMGDTGRYTIDGYLFSDTVSVWEGIDTIKIKIEIPYGAADAYPCTYPEYYC